MSKKNETLNKIIELGLIAVIRGQSKDLTVRTVDALVAGGVKGIEITYTTPNAEEIVNILKNTFGDEIVLGMGTLTSTKQAQSAKSAGAKFLVSPVCERDLVLAMVNSGLVTMAGALTPTEIFSTYKLGVDVVKIFPGSLTGPSYIKAVHGPFPEIKMMPTGGVSKDNISEWFAAGAVAVGAGSSLCPKNLVAEMRFDEITKLASEYVQKVIIAQDKKG